MYTSFYLTVSLFKQREILHKHNKVTESNKWLQLV